MTNINIVISEIEAKEIRRIISMLEELPYSSYVTKTSLVDVRRPLKFLGKVMVGGCYNCNGFAPAWLIAEKYRRVLRDNGFAEPKTPVFDHWDKKHILDQGSIYAEMIFA